MTKLIQRVKNHVSGQKTSGQNTLALSVECIEHGFEHDDFSPLVCLIATGEAKQSRNVKAIAGKVMQGYRWAKSDKADFGYKFVKMKDANQGIDETQMRKVKDFVANKKSIQSDDVNKYIRGEKIKSTFAARTPEKCAEAVKRIDKAELGERIKDAKAFLAALEAAAK